MTRHDHAPEPVRAQPARGLSRRGLGIALGAAATLGTAGCSDGASTYERAVATQRRAPGQGGDDRLPELVRLATLAASGHNTQPWRFVRIAQGMEIVPEFSRRTPVVDPDDHHLFVSLGCAAENLLIAAPALGLAPSFSFDSERRRIVIHLETCATTDDPLVAAIPQRQCTRSRYDGRPVPLPDLDRVVRSAAMPGVSVLPIIRRGEIGQLRDLVVAANRVQMADPAFIAELKDWIRFDPQSAVDSGDGLYSAASGNPTLPPPLGRRLFDLVFREATETRRYARQLDSSAGAAVFIGDSDDPTHWVQVGRAYQRFALQATALGIRHAFVNQPVEVPAARHELAGLLGAGAARPDLVLRFGYAPGLPFSLRRPVGAVLDPIAQAVNPGEERP